MYFSHQIRAQNMLAIITSIVLFYYYYYYYYYYYHYYCEPALDIYKQTKRASSTEFKT